MKSQFSRMLGQVLSASRESIGMCVDTEYVRSRRADAVEAEEDEPEVVQARWSTVQVNAQLQPGGFFAEGAGAVRIGKDAFADGYAPRRGDLVRWKGGDRWFEVKGISDHPLEVEWRLEVGVLD